MLKIELHKHADIASALPSVAAPAFTTPRVVIYLALAILLFDQLIR